MDLQYQVKETDLSRLSVKWWWGVCVGGQPLPPDCGFHKCFSVFFPTLGGTGWPEGAGVGYFPSPSSVRLWLNSFLISPEGRLCYEEQNALEYFKIFFPSPCQKLEGIFLWYSLWEPGGALGDKTHKYGIPPIIGPLGVFNSQSCPHWASSSCQLKFRFSYPGTGSHGSFCSWVSVPVSCDSLHLPVSSFGSSGLPYDLTLMNLKRAVAFSICLSFYFFKTEWWLLSVFSRRNENRKSLLTFSITIQFPFLEATSIISLLCILPELAYYS